jgi:hypothetical protein
VFGAQTWSNAIHITSGCNKQHFPTEHGTAYCRSYSEGGTTWYYYNWKYVDQYAVEQLCPGPWRVPTKEDFDTLVGHTDAAALISAWGYGGRAYDTAMEVVATDAYYWSATLLYNGADNAHNLHYSASTLSVDSNSRPHGFQVRCVK